MTKAHLSESLRRQGAESYESGNYTYEELGKLYGVDTTTVTGWVKRYRQGDKLSRKQNPLAGQQSKLGCDNCEELIGILKTPASEYGYDTDFWTTRRMQQVFKKTLKLKVSRMAIWRFLKKHEYSYRKPEARFYHRNKEVNSQEWIKKTVPEIKRTIKKYQAMLYFEDESNISLTPTVAKT